MISPSSGTEWPKVVPEPGSRANPRSILWAALSGENTSGVSPVVQAGDVKMPAKARVSARKK
jgi:hypothetical protein